MNPEKLSREEIEAKLTALLLGELPAEEAALLRWAITQDAGLAALHERLKQTVGFVREVAAQPEEATPATAASLKLSDERRQKLLAHFQTPRATPLLPPLAAAPESFWTRQWAKRRTALSSLATIAAVLALVGVLAALVLPNFVRARHTSSRNVTLGNLRQIEAAKEQWALEHHKSDAETPTAEDLKPYLRNAELPKPVAGEKYVIGKVGEDPKAELGGGRAIRLPESSEGSLAFRLPKAAASLPPAMVDSVSAAPPLPVIVLPGVESVDLDRVQPIQTIAGGGQSGSSPAFGTDYTRVDGFNRDQPAPGGSDTATFPSGGPAGWQNDGRERAELPPPARAPMNEAAPTDTTIAGGVNGKVTSSKMTPTLKQADVGLTVKGFYNDDLVLADRESGDKNGRIPVQTPTGQTGTLQWDGTLAGNWEEKELGGGGERGKGSDAIGFGRTKPDAVVPSSFVLAESAPADDSKLTKGLGDTSRDKSAEAATHYYADVSSPAKSQPSLNQPAADTKSRAYEADEQKRSAEFAMRLKDVRSAAASAPEDLYANDARQETGLPAAGPQASLSLSQNTFGVVLPAESAVLENVNRRALTVSATEAKKQLETREKLEPLKIELPAPLFVGTPVSVRLPGSPETEVARKREDKLATDAAGDKISVLGDVPVVGALFANKSDSSGPVEGLQHGTKWAGVVAGISSVTRDADSSVFYRLTTNATGLGKSGSGTWTMAGNNTYAGGTTISAGTLGVDQIAAEKTKEEGKDKQAAVLNNKPYVTSSYNSYNISDPPAPKAALPAPIPQPEILTRSNVFSTFSLNVSDVSFKLAAASLEKGVLPEAASIRSEEFINAFDYRDPEAAAGQPLAFAAERARYPFAHNRDLLRFSVKTAAAGRAAGRALNLVLLLDNSGSMERADRVAIIREALRVLATQLQPQDTVSVVTFARTARLWADGVRGDQAGKTLAQVGDITPEGGTNLEEAMRLAYATARRHYLATGMNRVVLLTDGAANLGDVNPAALKEKVEAFRKQGIALDCFGIGSQDFNDDLLEQLSRNGDGRYAFLNSPAEASTEFAAKLAGALQVAASDVKVQVEFNPQRVISYRQIGYAKHQLTKEQFRDNTVDAAEIAAQEAGNALYTVETRADGVGPIATVRVRYKVPGTTEYRETSWEVAYTGGAAALEQSSPAMRLAATASAFSEWLAASPFGQEVTPDALLKISRGLPEVYGADVRPTKLEWMIRQAKSLAGK